MTISREQLAELLSFKEPKFELAGREVEARDGYVLERLRFDFEGVGPVRGYLTRPVEAAGKRPAILYAHSHGDRLDIGADELLDGREYLQQPWGPMLARAGYVTLCIDMPCSGERAGVRESAAAKAAIWYGRSLIGQMVSDHAAALSYLAGRDDVDASRIGGFGISLGSTLTYWLAALDTRLKTIAHLCCYADYATLVELGAHDNHGVYLLVPGLLNHISTGEIAGMVAPRAQLICVGADDELTPPLSVERAIPVTRGMYQALGAGEKLEIFVQPGVRHQETAQMRGKVLALLARELRGEA